MCITPVYTPTAKQQFQFPSEELNWKNCPLLWQLLGAGADIVFGNDILHKLEATFKIGAAEYQVTLPNQSVIRRLIDHFEPGITPRSNLRLQYSWSGFRSSIHKSVPDFALLFTPYINPALSSCKSELVSPSLPQHLPDFVSVVFIKYIHFKRRNCVLSIAFKHKSRTLQYSSSDSDSSCSLCPIFFNQLRRSS